MLTHHKDNLYFKVFQWRAFQLFLIPNPLKLWYTYLSLTMGKIYINKWLYNLRVYLCPSHLFWIHSLSLGHNRMIKMAQIKVTLSM